MGVILSSRVWWLAAMLCLGSLAWAQADLPPRTISETHTQFGCTLGQAGDGDSMCFVWASMPTLLWGCGDVPPGEDSITALVPIPAARTTEIRCVMRRHGPPIEMSPLSVNKCDVTSTLPVGEGPMLPPTVTE